MRVHHDLQMGEYPYPPMELLRERHRWLQSCLISGAEVSPEEISRLAVLARDAGPGMRNEAESAELRYILLFWDSYLAVRKLPSLHAMGIGSTGEGTVPGAHHSADDRRSSTIFMGKFSQVADVMTHAPMITPETSVQVAAQKMSTLKLKILPVIESEESPKFAGIITDREITVRVVAESLDPSTTPVATAMTAANVVLVAEAPFGDAARAVHAGNSVVPVTDQAGYLVGMVTVAEISQG